MSPPIIFFCNKELLKDICNTSDGESLAGSIDTQSKQSEFALKQDEAITEEMKLAKDVYCPFGCGKVEERMHYMACTHTGLKTKRNELRWNEIQHMEQQRMDPMLLVMMNTWLEGMDQAEQQQ